MVGPDGSLTHEANTIEKLVSTNNKFQCASRRKEILISKLRIGKCALIQHLFLLKSHPDEKCQVCPQEDENVRHFLMECPAQSVLREEIRTRTNLSEMSSMLSNPASEDLIFRWICKNRINLIQIVTISNIINDIIIYII